MSSLNSLRDALKLSWDNTPLLLLHAQACLIEFEFNGARHSYERVLQQHPSHQNAGLGVIWTYYISGTPAQNPVRFTWKTMPGPPPSRRTMTA